MHAFLSNLANRQTDRQTNAGKRIYLLLCRRYNDSKHRAAYLQQLSFWYQETQCDKIRSFLIVVLHVGLIVFFMLF